MPQIARSASQNGHSVLDRQTDGVRARLAFVFDESPLGAITVSMHGQIVYINPVMREHIGYQPGEMLGQDASIIHPRFDAADRQVRGVLASGEPWSGRIWGKTKGGDIHWIHADLSPLRDAEGGVGYCLALCRDLSDPVRGEGSQPAAVPAHAEATFFMISDLEGVIQFESRTVSGLSQEDVINASLFDFVPPDQHDRVRANMERVIRTGVETVYETAAVGPDGEASQYVTKIAPIKSDDDVVALSFTSYDITSDPAARTGDTRQGRTRRSAAPLPMLGRPPKLSQLNRGRSRRKVTRRALSSRERDVLALLARGLTNRDVAARLRLSSRTVDHHVGHILRKLDVPNRTAAVLAARRRGLVAKQDSSPR